MYQEIAKDDYCVCGGLLQRVWMRDNKPVRTCDRCGQNIPVRIVIGGETDLVKWASTKLAQD